MTTGRESITHVACEIFFVQFENSQALLPKKQCNANQEVMLLCFLNISITCFIIIICYLFIYCCYS